MLAYFACIASGKKGYFFAIFSGQFFVYRNAAALFSPWLA